PYGLACHGPEPILRVHMSSGSTGAPVINPYTATDVGQWRGGVGGSLVAGRGPAAHRVVVAAPLGLFPGGGGGAFGGGGPRAVGRGTVGIPVGGGRTTLQLQLLRDLRATVLVGIASYPLRLIEVARQEGFDWKSTRLRVGVLGSEPWSDELRARIEAEMGIRTYDLIGMTETGGPGMGIECHARDGIHVWDDHYLPEIIDPATGRIVSDGERGELVVTTLTRQGLPLIRYRTRDITRIRSRERCECGRTGVRLDRFDGRTDDIVIYKGVKFYPSQIEQILLRQPGLDHEYQIVLDRDAARGDHLVLCVEADPGFDRAAEARLLRELGDRLSLTPEIRTMAVGAI